MSSRDFDRQRTELLHLLELTAQARESRLAELETREPELHAQVVSLLRHHDTPAPILEDGLLGEGLGARLAESLAGLRQQVPERIGPYVIREVIGEGGMGVVYRAEQTAPVQREVAIKHVRLGMDTARIVARFEAESQALARMNHPHIASVFDAGVDERGRPFFVMELVEGLSVTTWCRDRAATLEERLELFLIICDAVQHAHQKGVIHRDLKPGNLLVGTLDGKPHPKIIDFGIAKALDESDPEMTRAGSLLGTPHYMSPEQLGAFGAGADTRSDVYALGVVLYELLVGERPYRVDTDNPEDIRRIVLEERPVSPGKHLGRGTGGVPRDLDNIVMMALRKDPERRYSSVDQFADDIRRFRKGEPVTARASSWRYRAGKFIGRNRLAVTGAGALLGLLIGFTATTVVQAEKIRRERNRAVDAERTALVEAEAAGEVTDFLVNLFAEASPERHLGQPMTVRDLVDAGAARIHNELEDHPALQWRLLSALGEAYNGLGLAADADTLLSEAVALQKQVLGADHEDIAVNLERLGTVAHSLGEYALAAERYTQSLAMVRRLEGEDTARSAYMMNSLAIAYEALGEYDKAEPLYEQALELNRRLLGDQDPEVAWGLNTLGQIRYRKGDYGAAQALFEEAVDLARTLHGSRHPDLCAALNNLGGILVINGDFGRAEALLREALDGYLAIYGEDHPAVGRGQTNLAKALREGGRPAEALPLYEAGAATQRRVLGPDHPYYAKSLAGRGTSRVSTGHVDAGIADLHRALEIARSATDPAHPSVATQSFQLAEGLVAAGEPTEAQTYVRRALEIRRERLGPYHPLVAQAELVLADAFAAQGLADSARVRAGSAVEILRRSLGPDHHLTRMAVARFAGSAEGSDAR